MAQGKSIKPFDGFNTLINVLMGTGPILLPPVVASAGIGLSFILLVLLALISIIGAEFIIESLGIANCLKQNQVYGKLLNIQSEQISQRNSAMEADKVSEASFIQDQKNEPLKMIDEASCFKMIETIEYGSMGEVLMGRWGEILCVSNVVLYIFGVMITKGIIVGKSMTSVFVEVPILNNYTFWVVSFYIISMSLSFKDVASIAIIQTLVSIFRYLTIIMMYIGSIIIIAYNGFQPVIWFNMDKFSKIFGTTVLAFLMHHSTPQLLRPIEPENKIKTVLWSAFSFGTVILTTVPILGSFGFKGVKEYCYFNTVFDQKPLYFAYYIISFYMFLNFAALPVITITLRRNLMKLVVPQLLPKNPLQITKATTITTLLILVPSITLAMRDEIEVVVSFTGGLCGVMLMLVLPSLMVIKARKISPFDYTQNPQKSYFQHNIFAYIVMILGLIFIPYNIYTNIKGLMSHGGHHCQNNFDPSISL